MARPSNTAQRREQIIDGLAQLLPERGYDGASVAAIARAAGLSPGLVHYHFESKLAVLTALVHRLGDLIDARYARRSQDATAPWSRLDAFIDAHLALGDDADPRAAALWVVVSAEALRHPDVRDAYHSLVERAFERLHALLEAILDDTGRNEADVESMAAAILSAIQGAYLIAATAPDRTPPGFAAPSLKRMARGLLSGANP